MTQQRCRGYSVWNNTETRKSKLEPTFLFNAALESGREVFDAWRALTDPLYEMIVPGGTEHFTASTCVHTLADLVAVESDLSGGFFRRDPDHLQRSESLIWVTQFDYGEEHVRAGDRSYTLRPGAFYVRDMRVPSFSQSSAIRQRNICLSPELLRSADIGAPGQAHRVFNFETPAGRVLYDAFERVFEDAHSGAPAEEGCCPEDFLSVLTALLASNPATSRSMAVNASRYRAMQRYLLKRLDDPTVGVTDLCRDFGCSRSTVYRLFDDDGGVHRFLREQRLIKCCDQLTRQTGDLKVIRQIAEHWGYDDPAHFSRIFKNTFGVSPDEARRSSVLQAAELPVRALENASFDTFRKWFRCR